MTDFQFENKKNENQRHLPDHSLASSTPNEILGDHALWKAFIQGSEEAFITLYSEHFDHLIQYGHQFRMPLQDVEDSVQEVMINIRAKRKKLPELKNSIRSFLFKSLKNKIIDKVRAQQTRLRKESEALLEFEAFATIDEMMINKQDYEYKVSKLNAALEKLTNHQREVLYYLYQEKMSYSEIREILQLKHDRSVRNLVYRTLDKLRAQMLLK
jgi:RNA polymerase sigma-70 factor (ECF subfamily)